MAALGLQTVSLNPVTSMYWGRIGREAHMTRIEMELREEFASMGLPPVLVMNCAARAAAIFGGWDPFLNTWFFERAEDVQ